VIPSLADSTNDTLFKETTKSEGHASELPSRPFEFNQFDPIPQPLSSVRAISSTHTADCSSNQPNSWPHFVKLERQPMWE
jgi:hypothetical protein